MPKLGQPFCSQHSTSTRVVKGEDVLHVQPLHENYPESMLYVVCDGHSGVQAARFVAENLQPLLCSRLPDSMPKDFTDTKEMEMFAREVRKALCEIFIIIDNDWRSYNDTAGTTVTVMLVTGSLITVANVGDSAAVLDTGCSMLELTRSHRIQSDAEERGRLLAAGCTIAPLGFHLQGPAKEGETGVGPLRIWPGGLCVSRSVGDTDVGPHVVPIPNVKQVMVPDRGCRVIMASDGLWDTMNFSKAINLARPLSLASAAAVLVETAAKNVRVVDDVSIAIVDVVRPGTTFPAATRGSGGAMAAERRARSGGLFACFMPELEEPDSREAMGAGHLRLHAEVDFLLEDPSAATRLKRTTLPAPPSRRGGSSRGAAATRRTSGSQQQRRTPPPQGRSRSNSGHGGAAGDLSGLAISLSWHSGRVLTEQHSGALVTMGTGSKLSSPPVDGLDDRGSHHGGNLGPSGGGASPRLHRIFDVSDVSDDGLDLSLNIVRSGLASRVGAGQEQAQALGDGGGGVGEDGRPGVTVQLQWARRPDGAA